MRILLVTTIVALSSPSRADVDHKVNVAFNDAKMAEHNFECCYDRAVTEYKAKSQKCVDAIDGALKAGAAPDDKLGKLTLADARRYCVDGVKRVTAVFITGRMKFYATWPENLKKVGHGIYDAQNAVREADHCRKQVDDALAAGVPASAQIMLPAETLTLAQAKAKICDAVGAAGQGMVDDYKAKQEAKKAPYRKVLTGDKLNLLENLWGDEFYGAGGDPLNTPERLAGASAWFTVLTWSDDLGRTRWTLRKYAFSGDKAIGNATEKSGCCDSPPSSAYR